MRPLFIVLGSLFALALVAIIGLAILIPRVAKTAFAAASDPVAQKRVAAKIAAFTLPPGYRIRSATDLGISQTLIIERADNAGGIFQVQMTGTHVPSDSGAGFDAMSATFGFAAKFAQCDMQRLPDDTIVVRGRTYPFRAMACPNGKPPMHVEMGVVEGAAPSVQIIATEIGGTFDQAGFHKLLGSFK